MKALGMVIFSAWFLIFCMYIGNFYKRYGISDKAALIVMIAISVVALVTVVYEIFFIKDDHAHNKKND